MSGAVEEVHIAHRINKLKLKAAARYNITPERCHIGYLALEGMLESPNKLNQIDGGTGLSESNISVATRSMRVANAMEKFGLKPGDAVIIMSHNHLDLAIPYYACHFMGYSMCTMDPSVTKVDLLQLFPHIQPKMIFCMKQNSETIEEVLSASEMDIPVVVFEDEENDLEVFIRKHNGTEVGFRPADFDHSKTPAWLMLTSGTTGTPKVAIIPFDTLLNAVITWWTPFTAKVKITMTMATIQWLSSLMYYITASLKDFTRLQSSVPLTPQLLVGIINKYKVDIDRDQKDVCYQISSGYYNMSNGGGILPVSIENIAPHVTAWTPYMLGQFIQATGAVCDLSCFKYIAFGGSAIEKPLLDKFREKCDAYLYLVYGMTELLVPVFDFDENTPFGSTGKPSKEHQFKIVNDEGETLTKPGQSGELWIKGDAFFKGYLNNPEETDKILTKDGWFKTGDIFYRDENDYFFFVERKKILIRYMGYWIQPMELEEVIKRHPLVEDACVVSIPNPTTMELPVAAVVKKNGGTVDPQEIFNLVNESMPELKRLHGGMFFLESLPVTPSGKIYRAKIQDIARTAQRILPSES